jgi:hypothetical protein
VPDRSITPRGFAVYDEFTDAYGSKIRVQQSSSAETPRVWIFAAHPGGPGSKLRPEWKTALAGFDLAELASFLEPSPHLDVEQAKRVRDALDVFIREHEAEPREDREP